jgi:hypothetical protein
MSPDYFSTDNVLVVTFGEDPKNDTNAYQALTDLKQLDSQGQTRSPALLSSRAMSTVA